MQRESEIYDEKMGGKPVSGEAAGRRPGRPGGNGPRRPRLRLPFDDSRRGDIGVWAYNHRIGLGVTLLAFILAGVLLAVGRIVVGERHSNSTMLIDLQELAELEDQDRLQQEQEQERRQREEYWRSVRNLSSNENALNENLRDDRGTKTSQLNESAAEVDRRMRENREAYERGLAEAEELGRRKDEEKSSDESSSSKVAGMVTVSYLLNNPERYHRYLDKPAYRCEGGGEVVVNITVDRSGKVIAATAASGGDACMRETALHSARASTFNIDDSAPAKQTGTITYIFIPQ